MCVCVCVTDIEKERESRERLLMGIKMEQFKPHSSVSMIKFTYMVLSHSYCEDENQKINIYKCACKL